MENKNLEEARKINPSLTCEASYDGIEEEIIKHAVNRNGARTSRLINRDRTADLIRDIDTTLSYMPREKERSDEDKTFNELSSADAYPTNEISTGNHNLVRMEK